MRGLSHNTNKLIMCSSLDRGFYQKEMPWFQELVALTTQSPWPQLAGKSPPWISQAPLSKQPLLSPSKIQRVLLLWHLALCASNVVTSFSFEPRKHLTLSSTIRKFQRLNTTRRPALPTLLLQLLVRTATSLAAAMGGSYAPLGCTSRHARDPAVPTGQLQGRPPFCAECSGCHSASSGCQFRVYFVQRYPCGA